MASARVELELLRLEAQVIDLRDHLDAIGPSHPLFAPFSDELKEIEKKLKDIKKLLG